MAKRTRPTPRRRSASTERHATVVLSGGAPNSPLMAGALHAIYAAGKTFTNFYTSGAGATVGLIYVAPKALPTDQALEQMLQAGVHDAIYKRLPLGYKTFFKSGPFTVPIFEWAQRFKIPNVGPRDVGPQRLYNDWIDLWATTLCPTTLSSTSEGMCAHFPFVKQAVDFDKLKQWPGRFYMNAYCIDDAKMVEFHRDEIGEPHFDAALSFPLVYPPTKIGDKYYFEGSSHDPINLPHLRARVDSGHIRPDTLVLIDLLGSFEKALVRRPKSLLDAFGISILTPVVSLARKDLKIFQLESPKLPLLRITFDIPPEDYPTMADWSQSNMLAMWDIGVAGGKRFLEAHGDLLPDRSPNGPEPKG